MTTAVKRKRLRGKGAKLFLDLHSSGHCYLGDLKEFVTMLQPETILPCQANQKGYDSLLELCETMGYKKNKNFYILEDHKKIEVK